MEKIRQFMAEDSDHTRVVTCSWNERHRAWVCQSQHEDRFNCCPLSISHTVEELWKCGYHEHSYA